MKEGQKVRVKFWKEWIEVKPTLVKTRGFWGQEIVEECS